MKRNILTIALAVVFFMCGAFTTGIIFKTKKSMNLLDNTKMAQVDTVVNEH